MYLLYRYTVVVSPPVIMKNVVGLLREDLYPLSGLTYHLILVRRFYHFTDSLESNNSKKKLIILN